MVFELGGSWRIFSLILYAASWLFLLLAMYDADISLQSGLKGWFAVVRNRKPAFDVFPQRRTFAICRQPIYLAFALILWTAPVWSLDRVLFAAAWTLYCVIGPLRKEARYLHFYGDRYRAYQQKVAYFIPFGGVRSAARSKSYFNGR